MVKILGLGPGHEDYIIPKVIKELEKSDYIVGFERAISSLKFLNSINDERFKRVKGLKRLGMMLLLEVCMEEKKIL